MDVTSIAEGLVLREDGIWHSAQTQAISYPVDGNESCFSIEDTSFWFHHRNECIVSLVRSFPPRKDGVIFDVGGGNGFVSLGLANAGFRVAVLEPGPEGAANARRRGIQTVICATPESARLKPKSLPAVGLFDVVEHMVDDAQFLKSMNAAVEEGGMLYATVPAFRFLWSEEDVLAGHVKRYTLAELSKVLREAGFEVVFSSYIFRFLPLPIFLLRTLPFRLLGRSRSGTTAARDHAPHYTASGRVLTALLKSEIDQLRKKQRMRFGASCLVAARAAA